MKDTVQYATAVTRDVYLCYQLLIMEENNGVN